MDNVNYFVITPFGIGMVLAGFFGFIGLTLAHGFSWFDNIRK